MRNSKIKEGVGLDEEITTKQKIIAGVVLLSPFWILGAVSLLGSFYEVHLDKSSKPKWEKYDYVAKEPDIVYKKPKFQSGKDKLIPENRYGSGVTLQLHGVTIETGLTSEEIIQQLSIDYQDLVDQYGGADEIY